MTFGYQCGVLMARLTRDEGQMHRAQQLDSLGLERADGLEILTGHGLHVLCATGINVTILLFERIKRWILPVLLQWDDVSCPG